MKNADKPINAVLTQSPSLQNETSLGLTKREYFAGLAMQGLLAFSIIGSHRMPINLIKEAIEYADELLKQLEEK